MSAQIRFQAQEPKLLISIQENIKIKALKQGFPFRPAADLLVLHHDVCLVCIKMLFTMCMYIQNRQQETNTLQMKRVHVEQVVKRFMNVGCGTKRLPQNEYMMWNCLSSIDRWHENCFSNKCKCVHDMRLALQCAYMYK